MCIRDRDERVLSWSIAYANIIFGMSALLVVGVTFEKVYQAEGKMVTTMTGMMAGCIANIILDPLMIFGIGFFPKMGVQGACLLYTSARNQEYLKRLSVTLEAPSPRSRSRQRQHVA